MQRLWKIRSSMNHLSDRKANFEKAISSHAELLSAQEKDFLEHLSNQYHLTFQHNRQIAQALLEFKDWNEESLQEWIQKNGPFKNREMLWTGFSKLYEGIKAKVPHYPELNQKILEKRPFTYQDVEMKSASFKDCPTKAEAWICCDLKTINLVENCNFGCSYCALQDLYKDDVIRVATNIRERLENIQLDPNRLYRITTGELSDSLLWGNKNNLLAELNRFAEKHRNAIVELKTKSVNTAWLCENEVAKNLIVTWSLNPQCVIDHEESATPSLQARLDAAQKVSKSGIKIGFHFHPALYFEGAYEAYETLGKKVSSLFQAEELVHMSFGTLTLMKSQMRKIRQRTRNSKLLKHEFILLGDNKYAYPDEIRYGLYSHLRKGLGESYKEIPQYLCMEPLTMWQRVFKNFPYQSTLEFSTDFTQNCHSRLSRSNSRRNITSST